MQQVNVHKVTGPFHVLPREHFRRLLFKLAEDPCRLMGFATSVKLESLAHVFQTGVLRDMQHGLHVYHSQSRRKPEGNHSHSMFNFRTVISNFKTDLFEENQVVRPRDICLTCYRQHGLISSKYLPVSSVSSRKSGFWTVGSTNRSDSSFIPVHYSNDIDAVGPLQKRSLFQNLQQNPTRNASSTESNFPNRSQFTGSTVLVNPIVKEFTKIPALLNSKARSSTSD